MGWTREGVLEGLGDALKAAAHGGGQAHLACGLLDGRDSIAQRHAGREIERESDGRKLALVIDGKSRGGGCIVGKRTERHQIQMTVRRARIDVLEAIGILPEERFHFQHHVVLI